MAQYLDYVGLSKYDALIKALIKKGDDEILAFIGQLPSDASEATTVIDYLVSLINQNGGDTLEAIQEINSILGAFDESENRTVKEILGELEDADVELSDRLDAVEAAIDILNGDESVEGSIDKKIKDAIDAVVDGAPEALDTLKEIASWIASDETGSAELVSRVGELETSKEDHDDRLAAIEEQLGGSENVYDLIDALEDRVDDIREEEDEPISDADITALFLNDVVTSSIKRVNTVAAIQAISVDDAKNTDLMVSGDTAANALTATNKVYKSVAIGSSDIETKLTINADEYIVISGANINGREEDATGNGSINYAAKDLTVKNVNISGNTNYNVFEGTQVLNDSEAHLENLTLENIVVSDPTIKHNIANVYTPAEGAKIRIADSQFTLNSDNSNVLRVSNYLNSENLEIVFENCDWNYVAGSAQYAGLMLYQAAGADAAVSGDLSHIATWTIKFINCRYNGVKVTANNKDMSQALYTYGINGVNKAVCGEDAITSVGWTVVFE